MPFPTCFVVSLRRSTDRRQRILREFSREGVPFEFIDAIDADVLPADMRPVSPAFGLPMVAGDVACTMSHGRAMQTMLDRNIDTAIVFEDDATLAPDFCALVEAVLRVPLSWDVLKLSGSALSDYRTVSKIGSHQIFEPAIASPLAQGYVITASGARKIVPFASRPMDLFDHVLQAAWKTGAVILEVEPRLVGQYNGASTIADRDAYSQRPTAFNAWRRRTWKWRRSLWSRRWLLSPR